MVKCPNCGKEAHDNQYCGSCGTKIVQKKVCPQCNEEIDEESVFCNKCGAKIIEDSTEGESAEKTQNKEEPEEEKTEDEKTQNKEEPKEEKIDESNETKKDEGNSNIKKEHCPFCNTEIDKETVFCPECGKAVNIDKQSFSGIKNTIKFKNLIVWTIVSIIFSIVLSLIFCYLFKSMGKYYEIGFIISLIIVVGIFGSFKEIINGGLLGIITGLVLGLLSSFIIEISNGFSFSYEMLFGFPAIFLTILGLIMGIISSKYLRNSIKNTIDVEKILK